MKLVVGATILAAAFAAGPALAVPEDAFGTWRHPENGSIVKLYACGAGLCAQIVKTADPNAKDEKNPDPAKRGRPVAGIVIMSGATKSGDNGWKGNLYNREDGGTYSGSITVLDKSNLKLEGCAVGGLICRGVTWTRVGG
jgi:uncharacterized protein (DUF2147 family)